MNTSYLFWRTLLPTLALTTLALLPSCVDDEEVTAPTPYANTQIATYRGVSDGKAAFETQRAEHTPLVTLAADKALDDKYIGRRFLIEYTAALQDTVLRPMPVALKAAYLIPFDTVRASSPELIAAAQPSGTRIISQWRTGDFINLQLRYEFGGNAVPLGALVDQSTLGSPEVKIYLVAGKQDLDGAFVWRRTWASFYLGMLNIPNDSQISVSSF